MAAGTGGAGEGGEGGAGGTAGAGAGGEGGAGGTPSGTAPQLPEIVGECPEFTDGSTISVAGHRGVLIRAGQPGKGGPLLFYWHGTGSTPTEFTRTLPADVRDDIISSGGIIASFNGRLSSGSERDCSGTGAHNMADFKAADQIAACAVRDHGIDPRRIYTTGCSAGGLQSGCMAIMRSSYLAATAPNSGGITARPSWQDDHSPAVFTMHGGASDVVIVTFSQTSRAFDMMAKDHGSFVVNCNHGGGHCQAPSALQSAAWRFMKDHPWGFTESPWASGVPSGVPSYCTIF
jgi:poly(3-hydroxybutyrate) depolymerase